MIIGISWEDHWEYSLQYPRWYPNDILIPSILTGKNHGIFQWIIDHLRILCTSKKDLMGCTPSWDMLGYRSKQQHGSFFLGPVDFEDRVIALKKNMASPNIPTLPCSGFFGISFPTGWSIILYNLSIDRNWIISFSNAKSPDFREMFVIRWAHIWPTYPSKKTTWTVHE